MNSVIQLISQSKSSRLYEEKRDHVAFGKKNKCYSKGKKKKQLWREYNKAQGKINVFQVKQNRKVPVSL